MGYFTDMPVFLDLPSAVDPEERRKIDSFLGLLEDSGIGPIILSGVRSGTAKMEGRCAEKEGAGEMDSYYETY